MNMVEVYLQEMPEHQGHLRVCDFGHALMRNSVHF